MAQDGQDGGEVAADDSLTVMVGNHDAPGVAQAHGPDGVLAVLAGGGDGLGTPDDAAHSEEGVLEA